MSTNPVEAKYTGRVPRPATASDAAAPFAIGSNAGLRISPITAPRRLTISAFSFGTEKP